MHHVTAVLAVAGVVVKVPKGFIALEGTQIGSVNGQPQSRQSKTFRSPTNYGRKAAA